MVQIEAHGPKEFLNQIAEFLGLEVPEVARGWNLNRVTLHTDTARIDQEFSGHGLRQHSVGCGGRWVCWKGGAE